MSCQRPRGLFSEFKAKGLEKEISEFRAEERDGAAWKVFYAVAPDGLCYWFGEKRVVAPGVAA